MLSTEKNRQSAATCIFRATRCSHVKHLYICILLKNQTLSIKNLYIHLALNLLICFTVEPPNRRNTK